MKRPNIAFLVLAVGQIALAVSFHWWFFTWTAPIWFILAFATGKMSGSETV